MESLQLKPGEVIYKCPKCCSIKPERAHHCRPVSHPVHTHFEKTINVTLYPQVVTQPHQGFFTQATSSIFPVLNSCSGGMFILASQYKPYFHSLSFFFFYFCQHFYIEDGNQLELSFLNSLQYSRVTRWQNFCWTLTFWSSASALFCLTVEIFTQSNTSSAFVYVRMDPVSFCALKNRSLAHLS